MNSKLSVVICTYNPDKSIFEKCLASVAKAAEKYRPFEILIIDNNSTNGFADEENVKQFVAAQNVKLIKELKQGLTLARLRGIEESSGNLLVFIDDDNIFSQCTIRNTHKCMVKNTNQNK